MFKQDSLLDVCHHANLNIVVDDVRNEKLLKDEVAKADIIVPLAAIVGAPACNKDKLLATLLNQTQIENIANWVSKDQMLLYPVTNSGYGIGVDGIYCTEETPLNPISHYGITKVAGERALLKMGNAITFRLATVFGTAPRMRMDLLVNDFVYRAFNDQFIVLFEPHFKRNYIHIRDVSSVFLHAINNYDSMKGEAYNVGLSSANLSKIDQKKIENLKAVFSAEGPISKTLAYRIAEKGTGVNPKSLSAIHSIVKINERNKKKSIYLSPGHVIKIVDMNDNESSSLLKYLFEHQVKPEFVYGFEWEPNCLAIWSNYAVLHSPVNDFTGVDRVMHRITIQ